MDDFNDLNSVRFDNDIHHNHCFYPANDLQKQKLFDALRLDYLAAKIFLSNENTLATLDRLHLPNDIYHTLLTVSSFQYNSTALSMLINTWPYRVFSLQSQSNFQNFPFLLDDIQTPERADFFEMKQKIQLGLAILHSFLESLRNRTETSIKVLDLRGYPLGNIGINYLTCQGLLAHNERQRNEILRSVSSAVETKKISIEEASAFGDLNDLQSSIPEHSYAVIVDCFVNSEKSFKNLCKILTISKFQTCPIKLYVDKVCVSYGYDVGANLLLELINKNNLRGFGVDKLLGHHLEHILPTLQSFSETLTFLDFSGNLVDFSSNLHSASMTVEFFKSLKNLTRLDLSFCKLKRQLKRFLSAIKNGLIFLNLTNCDLSETDMIYLSSCHHCETLRELNLNENNFSTSTSSLCCLLKKCRNSLRILNLQQCRLQNSQAERIFVHLCTLKNIETINITKNSFLRQILINFCPLLKNHSSLQMLWLPYPAVDFHSPTPDNLLSEENQNAINIWRKNFEKVICDLLETDKNYFLTVKCAHVTSFNYANVLL